jgi:hypothetical protein
MKASQKNILDILTNKKELNDYLDEKSDLFSYGCIVYEIYTLQRLIKNPFLKEIQFDGLRTDDGTMPQLMQHLNDLIVQCCSMDFSARPSCEQLQEQTEVAIKAHNQSGLFYDIAIPSLDFRKNFSKLNDKNGFLEVNIENDFKPVSLTSLNLNRNLIVITVNLIESNDYPSLNGVQSKILIYTEFGDLLTEFQSYRLNERVEFFTFKIFYSYFDPVKSHVYLTTSANDYRIVRLKYAENFKYLLFDCFIDFSRHQFKPKIFNVIDLDFDSDSRYIVFSECFTNKLGLIKFDSDSVVDGCIQYDVEWVCEVAYVRLFCFLFSFIGRYLHPKIPTVLGLGQVVSPTQEIHKNPISNSNTKPRVFLVANVSVYRSQLETRQISGVVFECVQYGMFFRSDAV